MKKIIKSRIEYIFLWIVIIYLIIFLKIITIANDSNLKSKANNQQNYNITLVDKRADFYDCNFNKLTSNEKTYKALVFPTKTNINELQSLGCKLKTEKLQQLFKTNKPFVVDLAKTNRKNKNIVFFEDKKRYSSMPVAPTHIIGYVDKENNGISGLEYHLNDFLNKKKFKLNLNLFLNGKNQILNDDSLKFDSIGNPNDGVVLTIDSKIQFLLNRIGEIFIQKGAGVVLNAQNGEILAISSFPNFNPDTIAQYLNNSQTPLYNRTIHNYPLGSIFKIVTAAAALKKNIPINYSVNCPGYFKLNDIKFKCHKLDGHSVLDMPSAMKQSCNPYFIDLGFKVGAKNILNMAQDMGFSMEIPLSDTFYCKPSVLPNMNMPDGELANFSFGQGKLKTSILHIAQMLSIICNDGVGLVPQIIKGYIKDNKFTASFKKTKFECLTKNNAQILKNMLISSISGSVADSFFINSGGKSGTAQTGQFKENKKEILNTWYCSFSPTANPKFIIVLLKEDGELASTDLGPAIKILNSYLSL